MRLAILLPLSVCAVFGAVHAAHAQNPGTTLAEILEYSAQRINRQAPIQIDENTKLVGAVGGVTILTYAYTLNFAVTEGEKAKFSQETKAKNKAAGCVQLKPEFDAGGSVAFHYTDAAGEKFRWTLGRSDCR